MIVGASDGRRGPAPAFGALALAACLFAAAPPLTAQAPPTSAPTVAAPDSSRTDATVPGDLAPAIPVVSSPPERGFSGTLAVRGARVLEAENAGRLFEPASVLKLVVTAAALHFLGPDYRVTTRLVAGGELAGGTLQGDLVVEAAGDPTWNARFFPADPRRPLRELAAQLASRGVRRIAGDLVVDTSRFPGRPFPTSRPIGELAYSYAAPSSALAVGENTVAVRIAPGARAGDPATVTLAPEAAGTLRIVGTIQTVSRRRHGKGTVDFLPVWDSSTVVVRGEYPVSEPAYPIELSVPDGDLFAGRQLALALGEAGIELLGEIRVERRSVERGAPRPELAAFTSPPLAELLPPILADSRNWYAEMLLRLLTAAATGEGRSDDGLLLERRFLEEVVGLAPSSFELDDASGLSPYNLLAPEAVVGLLRWAWHQPWRPVFVAALARPGRGTLQAWPELPPLAGKTGTLRGALALAGYLDPGSDEPVIFVTFAGHRTDDRAGSRREIAERVWRWHWRRRAEREGPR